MMMSTAAPAPSPAPAPAPAVLASSQSTSVDDGLQLRIPVSALTEEFVCTICFGVITDCYMTRCGHNYCHSCIEEWATRSTNCPVCSKPFAASDLIKNSCFDNILQKISEERRKAREEYFSRLAGAGAAPAGADLTAGSDATTTTTATATLTPLEQLFRKHMQRTLGSFKQHTDTLQATLNARVKAIEIECAHNIDRIQATLASRLRALNGDQGGRAGGAAPPVLTRTTSESEAAAQIDKLTGDKTAAIASLQQQYDTCMASLLRQYDQFLQTAAPPANMLPVATIVRLPSHNVEFRVNLQCTDYTRDMDDRVRQEMNQLANPVIELRDTVWSIHSPLLSGAAAPAAAGAGGGAGAGSGAATALADALTLDNSKPIFEQCPGGCPPAGAVLVMGGTMLCQSDKPKVCFTAEFRKGTAQVVNYSTCVTCNINWVCEVCAQECHVAKGHTIKPHMQQHTPTYACCYCVKKRKCCIDNIKTLRK